VYALAVARAAFTLPHIISSYAALASVTVFPENSTAYETRRLERFYLARPGGGLDGTWCGEDGVGVPLLADADRAPDNDERRVYRILRGGWTTGVWRWMSA